VEKNEWGGTRTAVELGQIAITSWRIRKMKALTVAIDNSHC